MSVGIRERQLAPALSNLHSVTLQWERGGSNPSPRRTANNTRECTARTWARARREECPVVLVLQGLLVVRRQRPQLHLRSCCAYMCAHSHHPSPQYTHTPQIPCEIAITGQTGRQDRVPVESDSKADTAATPAGKKTHDPANIGRRQLDLP